LGKPKREVAIVTPMTVIKRIVGLRVMIGGEQHSGWLPENACTPLPIPTREVAFDIEIQSDGAGYVLSYASADGDLIGDNWYERYEDAMTAAAEYFGVRDDAWQIVAD
jgi:hypothetical protein